jgi:hypothetical protein
MDVKAAKVLVAGVGTVLAGSVVAHGLLEMNGPEIRHVSTPGPTVTETQIQIRDGKIPVPGPTVTKKVVETKTVRPKVPEHVTRSNERKKPKTSSVPRAGARAAAQSIFGSQFSCIDALITRESGWRVNATNPSSGAYGLPQALPGSKMASAGADWRTNPVTQLRWMKSYVDGRYGGACGAWNFWQSHHWY